MSGLGLGLGGIRLTSLNGFINVLLGRVWAFFSGSGYYMIHSMHWYHSLPKV